MSVVSKYFDILIFYKKIYNNIILWDGQKKKSLKTLKSLYIIIKLAMSPV
jgi:hypothetical protein